MARRLGASFAIVPLSWPCRAGLPPTASASGASCSSGSAHDARGGRWRSSLLATVLGSARGLRPAGHRAPVLGRRSAGAGGQPHRPDRYDSAFGHYTFAASAGQASAPASSSSSAAPGAIPDTRTIFAWASDCGARAARHLAVAALPGTSREPHRAQQTGSIRELLRRPGLVRALTVELHRPRRRRHQPGLPAAAGHRTRDLAASMIGVLLAARAAASMVSRLFLGAALGRSLGRRRLLIGSVALRRPRMALVPVPMPVWLLVLVVVARAWARRRSAADHVLARGGDPAGLRGRAMSLRLTGNRLGQVVVPSAAGVLALGAGAAGVLWITAAALAAVGSGGSRRQPTPSRSSLIATSCTPTRRTMTPSDEVVRDAAHHRDPARHHQPGQPSAHPRHARGARRGHGRHRSRAGQTARRPAASCCASTPPASPSTTMVEGDADLTFLAIEPAREAEVRFSPPYLTIEGVYVTEQGATSASPADVDSSDVRSG